MGYVKKIIGTAAFIAAVLIIPAIPAKAADVWQQDGWQQDPAQQWVYVEHHKKLVNQWVLWPDGTMRYVGDNGRIAVDRWVNVGEAGIVWAQAVPDMKMSGSVLCPSHRCPRPLLLPAGTTRERTEAS